MKSQENQVFGNHSCDDGMVWSHSRVGGNAALPNAFGGITWLPLTNMNPAESLVAVLHRKPDTHLGSNLYPCHFQLPPQFEYPLHSDSIVSGKAGVGPSSCPQPERAPSPPLLLSKGNFIFWKVMEAGVVM